MTEKITNGDFSSDLTSWVVEGTGTVTVDTEVFYTGSKSAKLQGWVLIRQTFDVGAVGKAYNVTAWVKTKSPYTNNPNQASPLAFVQAEFYTKYTNARNLSALHDNLHTEDWHQIFIGTFPVVAGDTHAEVLIRLHYPGATDSSIMWVDSVSVDEVTSDFTWTKPTILFNKDAVFNLWLTHEQADVLKTDTVPSGSVPGTPVALKMVKGGHEAFQLVMQPLDAEWDTVTWEWDNLVGPGTIASTNITMLRQLYITIDAAPATNPWQRGGDVPDPLVVETSSTLAQDDCSPFRFTVYIPPGSNTGVYTTNIRLKKGGVLKATIPVEVTVSNTSMPENINFWHNGNTAWGWVDDFETPITTTIRQRYTLNNFHHRIQDLQSFDGAWVYTMTYVDGHVVLDTTGNCDTMWAYMASLGMSKWPPRMDLYLYLSITPGVTYSYSGITYYGGDFHIGTNYWSIYTDETRTTFNPEFVRVFTELVLGLKAKMALQGLNNGYILQMGEWELLLDEQTISHIQNVIRLIRSIDPNIIIQGYGYVNTDSRLASSYHFWSTVDNMAPFYKSGMDAFKRVCNGGVAPNGFGGNFNLPPIKFRLYLWALYLEGYRGCFWWSTSEYSVANNPWDGVYNSIDFLYPPRGEYESGPIDSTRWEALGRGTEDVELFIKLERLIDSKRNLASPTDLATAQAALNRVGEMVSHVPETLTYVSRDQFCHFNLSTLKSIRSDVIDAIVLLEGYTTAHPLVNGIRVGMVNGVIPAAIGGVSN